MEDWIIRLVEWGGYWGVAALMLLETVFPPVPSEVIMSVAAETPATVMITSEGTGGNTVSSSMSAATPQ